MGTVFTCAFLNIAVSYYERSGGAFLVRVNVTHREDGISLNPSKFDNEVFEKMKALAIGVIGTNSAKTPKKYPDIQGYPLRVFEGPTNVTPAHEGDLLLRFNVFVDKDPEGAFV